MSSGSAGIFPHNFWSLVVLVWHLYGRALCMVWKPKCADASQVGVTSNINKCELMQSWLCKNKNQVAPLNNVKFDIAAWAPVVSNTGWTRNVCDGLKDEGLIKFWKAFTKKVLKTLTHPISTCLHTRQLRLMISPTSSTQSDNGPVSSFSSKHGYTPISWTQLSCWCTSKPLQSRTWMTHPRKLMRNVLSKSILFSRSGIPRC